MSDIDRTATMTNNTTPAPNVVTASSEGVGEEGWHAFDKDSVSGAWITASGTTGNIKYDFGSALWAADGYTLTDNGFQTRMPSNFTFQGSNDDSAWTTLDTQTSQTFSASETKTYSFANSVKYRYYKLDVTANGGGSNLQIAEMTIKAPDDVVGGFIFMSY